jgi:hypothetical protein
VDRSHRFLAALERAAAARGFANIEIVESDVNDLRLAHGSVDVVWCRWLLIFTPIPRAWWPAWRPSCAPAAPSCSTSTATTAPGAWPRAPPPTTAWWTPW